jgi:Family of unknown function (DUF6790)
MNFDPVRDIPIPGIQVYLMVIFIVISTVAQVRSRPPEQRTRLRWTEHALMNTLGIGGFFRITAGLIHLFWGDSLAQSVGWPAGSPFQTEVGFAVIASGVTGYLCYWHRDWWTPQVISTAIFSMGAGAVHVVDIIQHANFSPGNAGPTLYADVLIPLVLIGLLVSTQKMQKAAENSIQAGRI